METQMMLTTQDERPVQAEQDDTRGYIWPLVWAVEIAIGAAVVIGFSGPEVRPAPAKGGVPVGATCPVE